MPLPLIPLYTTLFIEKIGWEHRTNWVIISQSIPDTSTASCATS